MSESKPDKETVGNRDIITLIDDAVVNNNLKELNKYIGNDPDLILHVYTQFRLAKNAFSEINIPREGTSIRIGFN